jgi:hypothetical protein
MRIQSTGLTQLAEVAHYLRDHEEMPLVFACAMIELASVVTLFGFDPDRQPEEVEVGDPLHRSALTSMSPIVTSLHLVETMGPNATRPLATTGTAAHL